jgi:glycosyltransferase involved in cell wall biosynthesis
LVVTFDYRLWNSEPRIQPYRDLANQPGIEYVGMLPRAQLLQAQAEAEAHIYPCTFDENFCLASLECQLQSTPTFGTTVGALPTTIGTGGSCSSDPVGEVIRSLQQPQEQKALLQAAAKAHALSLTWDHTAAAWERFLA